MPNLYYSVALLLVIRDDTVCTWKVVITGGVMLFTLVASKQTLPSALFRQRFSFFFLVLLPKSVKKTDCNKIFIHTWLLLFKTSC